MGGTGLLLARCVSRRESLFLMALSHNARHRQPESVKYCSVHYTHPSQSRSAMTICRPPIFEPTIVYPLGHALQAQHRRHLSARRLALYFALVATSGSGEVAGGASGTLLRASSVIGSLITPALPLFQPSGAKRLGTTSRQGTPNPIAS